MPNAFRPEVYICGRDNTPPWAQEANAQWRDRCVDEVCGITHEPIVDPVCVVTHVRYGHANARCYERAALFRAVLIDEHRRLPFERISLTPVQLGFIGMDLPDPIDVDVANITFLRYMYLREQVLSAIAAELEVVVPDSDEALPAIAAELEVVVPDSDEAAYLKWQRGQVYGELDVLDRLLGRWL